MFSTKTSKRRLDEEQAAAHAMACRNRGFRDMEEDELLGGSAVGWHPHLELTRIVCVFFVSVEHAQSYFSDWNVMYVQNWVLQYLFLTVGVCFGLSRKSLPVYILRLVQYLVLGVGCNWTAFVILGKDWRHDFFNVVFQMWFVVGVILISLLLSPLRPYLSQLRAESSQSLLSPPSAPPTLITAVESPSLAMVFTGLGIVGIWGLALIVVTPVAQMVFASNVQATAGAQLGGGGKWWGFSPSNPADARALVAKVVAWSASSLTSVWIVVSLPQFLKDTSIIAWVMYINMFVNRLIIERGRQERPFHALDLTLLGLVCYYLGMKGCRRVGDVLLRYWWLGLMVGCLLWQPGTHGRQDVDPPHDLLSRTRFCIIEAFFVLLWLTVGERVVDARIFQEDQLGFLTEWALVTYMTHQAVHLVCPHPLNWLVLAAFMPACYAWRQKRSNIDNWDEDDGVNARLCAAQGDAASG